MKNCIPSITCRKCEILTSTLTAGLMGSWLTVKADQLRRQVDFIWADRPELKCGWGFFTKGFECNTVGCPAAGDITLKLKLLKK